jgi:predicted O-methyltransferase YrrM
MWRAVDEYAGALALGVDPVLDAAVADSASAGLPEIQVSPLQGRFLEVLARAIGARSILEIGTLGGYSATCLGRALPADGRLVTLEREEKHAAVARRTLARAGLSDRVQVRVGPALELLPFLAAERGRPFDLSFLDADRPHLAEYMEWAVRLSRPGGVIVVDNVVRRGEVLNAGSANVDVQGVRRMNDQIARDSRVLATVVQTVGVKGYDGFALALVLDPHGPSPGGMARGD